MASPSEESPREFEREVASIYRVLGCSVKHDVAIAGNQIDVVIREQICNGPWVVTIVECKAYQRPVGLDVVNAFKKNRDRHYYRA